MRKGKNTLSGMPKNDVVHRGQLDAEIGSAIEERKRRWPAGVDPEATIRGMQLYEFEELPDRTVRRKVFLCFDDVRAWTLQWLEFLANPATWTEHNHEREAAIARIREDLGWWLPHFGLGRHDVDSFSLPKLCEWLRIPQAELSESRNIREVQADDAPELKECEVRAGEQWEAARGVLENESAERVTRRMAWERVKEDDTDHSLPAFETWNKYVRTYLRAQSKQTNSPRAGRTGRSIVKSDEL